MLYFLGYYFVPLMIWSIIICIVAIFAGYQALIAGAIFIALHIVFYLVMGIYRRR